MASSDHMVNPMVNYFWKRKMLHLGAYGLVTALPISFFFFGQMKDAGGVFNNYTQWGMTVALLAFLGLAVLPVILYQFLYSKFNYERIYKVGENVEMMMMLKNTIEKQPEQTDLAQYNDPLWSINEASSLGYIWAAFLYYKMMLFAWFASFFIGKSTYQLFGMLTLNGIFLMATLFSEFFTSSVYKYFFVSQILTLMAYEFLVAGLGSDRGLSTSGFLNLGYLGIGLIYANIIPSFLLSCYRVWFTLKHIFMNYFAKRKFLLFKPRTIEDIEKIDDKRSRTIKGRKSTIMDDKRMNSRFGSKYHRTNMVPGSQMLFRYPQEDDGIKEKKDGTGLA